MLRNKAFVVRLYPNTAQTERINRTLGCARFVYNHFLARRIETYRQDGKRMTYYGRWTYKFEIASKLGAAGAIIVHETEPAAYPWAVVESSWGGEQFSLANPDQNMSRVPVQSWITVDKARELFTAAGQDFDELKRQSLKREFAPVALPAKASFAIKNKIRQVQSQNVVAKITGSDPELADEVVIYTAHWDHLGKDTALKGDQIYNGAVDNASGTAAVLEIAAGRAAELGIKPHSGLAIVAVGGLAPTVWGWRREQSRLYDLAARQVARWGGARWSELTRTPPTSRRSSSGRGGAPVRRWRCRSDPWRTTVRPRRCG